MSYNINMFMEHLNKEFPVNEGINKGLLDKFQSRNFEQFTDDQISKVAKKTGYFIHLCDNLSTKELTKQYKEIKVSLYDFEPGDKQNFLKFFHLLNKFDLLILDLQNILGIDKEKIVISTYRKKDIIKEFFNFLLHQFRINCEAMYKHIVMEKEEDYCGFYGYIDVIDTLLTDETFFTR